MHPLTPPARRRLYRAGLLLCFALPPLCGCSRAVERKGEAPPADTAPVESSDQVRRRYIQASIEIGCLTRRETEPQRVAAETLEIYRRHGFAEVMGYLTLVETVGQEKAVQQEIADGLKGCP